MAEQKINDGGPAFPVLSNVEHNSDWETEHGMSLRDHIAAKAMSGVLSGVGRRSLWQRVKGAFGYPVTTTFPTDVSLAKYAYECADAMLAERAREHATCPD